MSILDDASAENPFSADPYIRQKHARSVLCLPLLKQATLVGVLYLENNLSPSVFTRDRIAVLNVLASQAAISLENTRLYRDLAEREAKIRRLVDANIIGIFIWNIEGRIVEANDAFLRMVGYDREDLASGRVQLDGHDAAGMARPRRTDGRRAKDGPESVPPLREGILPQRRQPCPRADRRQRHSKREETKVSLSCLI